jgi:hypothetical protein
MLPCTATGGQTMSFNFGSNTFQAHGDGIYDILVDFSTSAAHRLTLGEAIVFDLTSTTLGFTSDNRNRSARACEPVAAGEWSRIACAGLRKRFKS